MKIKSLLAAVSMVAITAGAANALEIDNVSPAGIVPALELELPGNPALTGVFTFDLLTETGQYPNGDNLTVVVNLPDGIVFAQDVTGLASDPARIITSADVQTTVNAAGKAGDSTVTLTVSLDDQFSNNNLNGTQLPFQLNLELASCPAAGDFIEVQARLLGTTTEDGNIEEGSATTNNVIAPCESGISGMVMSDEGVSDTKITLGSGYTDIAEFPGSGPLNADGVLGTIQYKIDPTVSKSLTSVQPLVAGDVAAFMFDVVFEDASGIASVFVNGIPSTKSGNVFTVMATSGADKAKLLDATPDSIIALTGGTAVIPTQTVSVGNSKITFRTTGTPDLIASEAGPSGALDTLQREGREFGYFDWNAGPAIGDPTLSVYRITGLDANESVDYSVTLENSNNNGTYAGSVTANSYGEAQLISTLMPVPADTERFDVLINIETPNGDVDVDRLMLRTGIVTAFNDGANNDQEDIKEPNLNDDDN